MEPHFPQKRSSSGTLDEQSAQYLMREGGEAPRFEILRAFSKTWRRRLLNGEYWIGPGEGREIGDSTCRLRLILIASLHSVQSHDGGDTVKPR